MSINKTSLALLAAAGMAVSCVSMAQSKADTGWYIGATFGQTQVDLEDCGGGVTCDDKDTGWRIIGGYLLNRNFAIEVGYHDLGKASQSAPGASLDFKANAFELLAVGMLPITNEFSLYGKAGLYRGEVEATLNITGLGSDSLTETNTDLTYGFGAQYNFTRNVGVRAEWQRYTAMGDNATIGESDVDVMSLGIVYRFQ